MIYFIFGGSKFWSVSFSTQNLYKIKYIYCVECLLNIFAVVSDILLIRENFLCKKKKRTWTAFCENGAIGVLHHRVQINFEILGILGMFLEAVGNGCVQIYISDGGFKVLGTFL